MLRETEIISRGDADVTGVSQNNFWSNIVNMKTIYNRWRLLSKWKFEIK